MNLLGPLKIKLRTWQHYRKTGFRNINYKFIFHEAISPKFRNSNSLEFRNFLYDFLEKTYGIVYSRNTPFDALGEIYLNNVYSK